MLRIVTWRTTYSERRTCFVSSFSERVGPRIYRLKELITLEQVNTSVVEKKQKTLCEQDFDGEANGSAVVNFY